MFGNIISSVTKAVDDFIDDPVGETTDYALNPIHNTLDVLEGLTEGEIRTIAATKLGADIVAGMALSEIIEVLLEEEWNT